MFFWLQELRQRFAPFFLRRLKSEVFPESEDRSDQKLSRKNDLIVWLRPSKHQVQSPLVLLLAEAPNYVPLQGMWLISVYLVSSSF